MKKKIVEKIKKVLKAVGLVIAGVAGATVYFLIRKYMREPVDMGYTRLTFFNRDDDPNMPDKFIAYIKTEAPCNSSKYTDINKIFLSRECARSLLKVLDDTLSGADDE